MNDFIKTIINGLITRVQSMIDGLKFYVDCKLEEKQSTGDYVLRDEVYSKDELSKVSTSGSYNDLINKPTIPSTTGFVRYDVVQSISNANKTRARENIGAGTSNFDGSYKSLSDKPKIPEEQIQSDWNINDPNDKRYIANKPFYENHTHTIPNISVIKIPAASTLSESYPDLYYGTVQYTSSFTEGNTYYVSLFGYEEFHHTKCGKYKFPGQLSYCKVIGNSKILFDIGRIEEIPNGKYHVEDTGEDWALLIYESTSMQTFYSYEKNARIESVYLCENVEIKKIDERFIPSTVARSSDIPTDDHINELINTALGVIENGTY